MRKNSIRYSLAISALFIILFSSSFTQTAKANDNLKIPEIFEDATQHFMIGEYNQAVILLDEILEISPNNTKSLLMKGIALSNLERHKSSILEFNKVLTIQPDNLMALLGMGVGFGNFGEYKQAHKYFLQAHDIASENHIVTNYKEFAEKVITKYPYTEVDGPKIHEVKKVEIVPDWIKNSAGWWAEDKITDVEFTTALQFLIQNEIIKIESVQNTENDYSATIPTWIKNNAKWWAEDKITEDDFLSGIYYMIENGIIIISVPEKAQLTKNEQLVIDRNMWEFERYLDRIIKTVSDDGRYIEYPNPSGDVIKKFMRDYVKWNFDQQIEMGNSRFPSPTVNLIRDTYFVEYKVYVNKQPNGLPLDHVGTLDESFRYWEERTLSTDDGKKVKITFTIVPTKANANLWVTWIVRSLGENVLGHANLGKGVVEVALGGYGCDGNFQLYHVETVKQIMTHELGHGIGLMHSDKRGDIMYPSLGNVDYAYCLLDVNKQFTKELTGIVLKNQS